MHLMCAQARECLFEKAELHSDRDKEPKTRLESHLILGQEAAHVSEVGGVSYTFSISHVCQFYGNISGRYMHPLPRLYGYVRHQGQLCNAHGRIT